MLTAVLRVSLILFVVAAGSRAARAQPEPPEPTPAAPAQVPAESIDLTGRVIDAFGHPVRGAAVAVDGVSGVAITDAAGRYHVAGAPIGASIVVDAAGYTAGIGTVSEAAAADVVLLTEQQSSEVIDVHGDLPPASPGAAKLERTEMTRVPGTGGDLVRTLSIMPGVVAPSGPSLGRNGIVIRGSAPQDSKLLIDGFEVPLLYHTIGARAIVPTEAVLPPVTVGASLTAVILMTKLWGEDVSLPPFATPPLSCAWTVTVADPAASDAPGP
jgi:hypothetical protein